MKPKSYFIGSEELAQAWKEHRQLPLIRPLPREVRRRIDAKKESDRKLVELARRRALFAKGRSPRFVHGAGMWIGALAGALLWLIIIVGFVALFG